MISNLFLRDLSWRLFLPCVLYKGDSGQPKLLYNKGMQRNYLNTPVAHGPCASERAEYFFFHLLQRVTQPFSKMVSLGLGASPLSFSHPIKFVVCFFPQYLCERIHLLWAPRMVFLSTLCAIHKDLFTLLLLFHSYLIYIVWYEAAEYFFHFMVLFGVIVECKHAKHQSDL